MTGNDELDILLVTAPGQEPELASEARDMGFVCLGTVVGGVTIRGGWPDVWRANLVLRGATHVLARIGSFRVSHLAQLDKRARSFPWREFLRRDVPVRVETSCKASRIYHSGAATQRIETALREELGIEVTPDAGLCIKARIENDLCTISIDTSGDSLHKRGHKEAIGKAPMRETMAAMFLRQCGYQGTEPVVDPMCGSGTFVIEAAEIAAGLAPGRSRSFAFGQLANFDAATWRKLQVPPSETKPEVRFYGSDRDAGAVRMSRANAERAGVAAFTTFEQRPISDILPPGGKPGLVIVNPPYGTRIGDKKPLFALHGALGRTLMDRFTGWRVGLITTDSSLAKATGLPFHAPTEPVAHGGLRVRLYQTSPLQ